MAELKQKFGDKSVKRTKNFSLASEIGGSSFNQQSQPSRPSYKAAVDERGHVKMTKSKTHVMVTNENASGERKSVEHQLPVMAAKRYCDMLKSGEIKAQDENEIKNSEVLSKAIAPHVRLAAHRGLKS